MGPVLNGRDEMKVGSKEHTDMMAQFEKDAPTVNGIPSLRLARETKDLWPCGQIYQDGFVNQLFKIYSLGYACARCTYMN